MRHNNIKQKGRKLLLSLLISWNIQSIIFQQSNLALADDITTSASVTGKLTPNNVGGGLSHLADGDILAFTFDFAGTTLVRIDANGDNIPEEGTRILAQFPSLYGDFVRVSPNGKFALAGVSGGSSDDIYKIDLTAETVIYYTTITGNFDLAFISNEQAYISYNSPLYTAPNRIDLLEINDSPTRKTVIETASPYSGPIALNSSGDLYYVGTNPSTFAGYLLKFSAAQLANAVSTGTPLVDSDSSITAVPLSGGYNLAYHQINPTIGELFYTDFSSDLYRINEISLTPEKFLKLNNPNVFAMTGLSFFKPTASFGDSSVSQAELAVSATDFGSNNSLLQVRPTNYDSDGDNVMDSADLCSKDVSKTAPGTCGCGEEELDSNNDKVIDCGLVKTFTKGLTPSIGSATGGDHTLSVVLEKFADANVKYYVEIQGPSPKKSKRKITLTKGNTYTFKKLKPGTYKVKFYAKAKVNVVEKNKIKKKNVKSATSQTLLVTVTN